MHTELKEGLENWLDSIPPLAGVLACGMRMPDRSTVNRSFDDGFPDASLDNAWRCVADTLQVLRSQRLPGRRLRWTYENHLLQCAVRSDGAFLGIITTSQREELDEIGIEETLVGFTSLSVI